MSDPRNSPVFPQGHILVSAVATTANTIQHGAGATTVLLYDPPATDWAAVEFTSITAIIGGTAAMTGSNLQLFWSTKDSNGAAVFAIKHALASSRTPAGNVTFPEIDFGYTEDKKLLLPPGIQLRCATGIAVAAGVIFTAQGRYYVP
jgi:hypothetical protein